MTPPRIPVPSIPRVTSETICSSSRQAGRRDQPVEGRLDGGGVERRPVMERDALAEFELYVLPSEENV
jgi:hypothetical protein